MRRNSKSEPLGIYLKEIAATPLLTREQERDLSVRIKSGDMEARDLLIRSNLRFVVNIARQHQGRGIPLADLIEDGNMGLIRAAEGYDVSYGTRFSTYASFWIKQSIKRGIQNTSRMVRVPTHMIELMREYGKAKAALTIPGLPEPTEDQIAKKAGIKKKQLKILKKAQELSQLMTDGDGDKDLKLDDLAVDESVKLYSADEVEILLKFVDKLPPQEGDVIRMRFGMDCDELTLKEIGEIMGVTRERIRQIEAKALERLTAWINGDFNYF